MSEVAAATRRRGERSRRVGGRRRQTGTVLYVTAGCLISAIFVVPLLWEVLRSFEPTQEITSPPALAIFSHLGIENYRSLLVGSDDVVRNVVNSLVVALATALLTTVIATLAGYGFGRFRFRGSGVVFAVVLVGFMVPFQAVLTPLFLELHDLHLLNSLVGLWLFYTAFNLPFGIYIMRNTFAQVPDEIVDAARVDGASVLATLTRVLRAIVMPGIATSFLFAFLFAWTEFLGALTFLTSSSVYTLPVALSNVETGTTYGGVNFGYLTAGAVIAMVPCVIVYAALQRFYVRGLLSGAVKG
jgi:multiple sugar transport system permease protein